ncbi:MAG: hypothetical protein HQ512_05575 [Rhodospirillales bacterium]|nr:hypothetical protein [Rhodospirillales bacterium]
MYKILGTVGALTLLGACGYVDKYEEAVYDMEPTYCYKSIGGVACYKEPYHRDEKRIVNYFGPHPSRFDKPEPAEAAPHSPPQMINYWVKDAEPIPRPAPTGKVSELPWLDPELVKLEAEKNEFTRQAANPKGTQALLKNMGIGPHGEIDLKTGPRPMVSVRPKVQATAPKAAPVPPVIEVDVN